MRLNLPDEVEVVAFADDIVVKVTARTYAQAKLILERTARIINDWLVEHGLELAASKTELVVLTRQRKFVDTLEVQIIDDVIREQKYIKYLGVLFDSKMTFFDHIRKAAEKAEKLTAALTRIMPNVNGPREEKKRILMSVIHSIMLYGSEMWGDALDKKTYRKRMAAVQRTGALRVAAAYRTVSESAVLVVASVIPIHLLADEKMRCYLRKGRGDSLLSIKKEEREITIAKWQTLWNSSQKGKWTRRLIPNILPWIEREHGEVNFHLSQFLTGHGHFNKYLYNMNRKRSPIYDYCKEYDDVQHTFFHCDRWSSIRREMELEIGKPITTDNVIGLMLKANKYWNIIAKFVIQVLKTKKSDEMLQIANARMIQTN